MKTWLRITLVALAAGWLPAGVGRADTSDVFQLQTLIHGVTQWDLKNNPGKPRIQPVQLRAVDLINLGLGRSLTNPVPHNERLALVTQCANNDMRIIVYDTMGQTNLMTHDLGHLQALSVIEALRGDRITRNIISALTFEFAGISSNGLYSGSLDDQLGNLVAGTFFATGTMHSNTNEFIYGNTNDCLIQYTGQIVGALGTSFFFTNTIVTNVLDITVTNTVTNTFLVISNFNVNVSSSTMSAGGAKLGTLIEP